MIFSSNDLYLFLHTNPYNYANRSCHKGRHKNTRQLGWPVGMRPWHIRKERSLRSKCFPTPSSGFCPLIHFLSSRPKSGKLCTCRNARYEGRRNERQTDGVKNGGERKGGWMNEANWTKAGIRQDINQHVLQTSVFNVTQRKKSPAWQETVRN